MLDKEDLQAIKKLIDASLGVSEERTDVKLAAMEERTDVKLTTMEQRTDAKLTTMEQRTDAKLTTMEQRIITEVTQSTLVMMEQYFQPRFDLLAENQKLILQKLDGKVDKEDCQNSMSVVAAAVRAHSRDIEELKAQ